MIAVLDILLRVQTFVTGVALLVGVASVCVVWATMTNDISKKKVEKEPLE